MNWIGVAMPVGRMSVAQMRGLADVARDFGDGDLRLTVWQNLLISGVADGSVSAAQAAIAALGLSTKATSIRAGLVACTGNVGCKFAASDTKRHAEEIAQWCEARVALDTPINIHLTGCHHSCAQHFISDIGLLACKVEEEGEGDEIEQIEGYHVYVGGGFGPEAAIGREIYRDVKADGPAAGDRAHVAGLSRQPRRRRRNLPRLFAPARGRRAERDVRRGGGGMTQNASPPMLNLVPDSAPFSEEQRAWLNGFLAGFISLDGATPVTNEQVAALMAGGRRGSGGGGR